MRKQSELTSVQEIFLQILGEYNGYQVPDEVQLTKSQLESAKQKEGDQPHMYVTV
jgi:hypothetical protein